MKLSVHRSIPGSERLIPLHRVGPLFFRKFRSPNSVSTAIIRLHSVPPHARSRTIAVRRSYEIEPSSTCWHPDQLIEHLLIVNRLIVRIIRSLAEKGGFGERVETADLKPNGKIGYPWQTYSLHLRECLACFPSSGPTTRTLDGLQPLSKLLALKYTIPTSNC